MLIIKCSAIYDALSVLDESSTNERIILKNLIFDLKQTIQNELEKNIKLFKSKLEIEQNEKYFKQKFYDKTEDFNKIMMKYRRIYINQQQEKYIQDNLIIRKKNRH